MEFKQVIVIRKDLGMSKGKLAAQACHACLGSYLMAKDIYAKETKQWLSQGGKKIIVYVDNEAELIELNRKLTDRSEDIPHKLIVDAGLTELEPGTITCLGIGPYYEDEIDNYTGELEAV